MVRIRPANGNEREGDRLIKKVSDDSVTVGDRKFTFDSVLDSKSNQVSAWLSVFLLAIIMFSTLVVTLVFEQRYMYIIRRCTHQDTSTV